MGFVVGVKKRDKYSTMTPSGVCFKIDFSTQ